MNTKLAKIDFYDGQGQEKNKSLTRTGIQYALGPVVAKVLSALPGYDPFHNVAHARRTLRALMTIAIQPLISMGAPKEFMREQLMDALDNALNDQAANFKAGALEAANDAKAEAQAKKQLLW